MDARKKRERNKSGNQENGQKGWKGKNINLTNLPKADLETKLKLK